MKIKAISISDKKGTRKENIQSSLLVQNHGLQDDAHAGTWHRQVSFLAEESIQTMRDKGLDVVAGNFAENITTEGLDLTSLEVGTHLTIGDTELIISQLGKICHNRCAIYHQAGDCVMPREGIFGIVLSGGPIHVGDTIELTGNYYDSVGVILTAQQEKVYTDQLLKKLQDHFDTPLVRFDTFNPKRNSLEALVKDLTEVQKVTNLMVLDPELNHGLNLMHLGEKIDGPNTYKRESSVIGYFTSVDELLNI